MIKILVTFLGLYLICGAYIAYDWILYECSNRKCTKIDKFWIFIYAAGLLFTGPAWLFIKVVHNVKGE